VHVPIHLPVAIITGFQCGLPLDLWDCGQNLGRKMRQPKATATGHDGIGTLARVARNTAALIADCRAGWCDSPGRPGGHPVPHLPEQARIPTASSGMPRNLEISKIETIIEQTLMKIKIRNNKLNE